LCVFIFFSYQLLAISLQLIANGSGLF